MCSWFSQLAPLTRGSPATTSFALRRLLSSEARTQIQKAVDASPLVLFMKGTPDLPQCGFSRAVIQVLDLHGVPNEKMRTYNVLEDPELRNGIKEFSCVCSQSNTTSSHCLSLLKRVANSSPVIRQLGIYWGMRHRSRK